MIDFPRFRETSNATDFDFIQLKNRLAAGNP
jgi:hypothetical protein